MNKKTVLIIQGSLRANSSNQQLVDWIRQNTSSPIDWQLSVPLDQLPFFNPDLDGVDSVNTIPSVVSRFRQQVAEADAILIVSPEYVFSLPGVLKNALEWLVSTTLLADKPTGLIIAAASGEKALEQLGLILNTLEANYSPETRLLIKGIKGKIVDGMIGARSLIKELQKFTAALFDKIDI